MVKKYTEELNSRRLFIYYEIAPCRHQRQDLASFSFRIQEEIQKPAEAHSLGIEASHAY
jgi:hypothetical protein